MLWDRGLLFDLAATANLGKLRNGRGLVRRTWSLGPWDGRSESGLWGYFDVDTDMKGGRRGVVEKKVLSLVRTYTKNLDLIK